MDDTGNGGFRWATPVRTSGNDAQKQWGENYTPLVTVETVEIFSRDAAGVDHNEDPVNHQLNVVVPRPGGIPPALTCVGAMRNGKFTFAIPQDCSIDDNQLRALTPTYAPAFLGQAPAVTVPIGWSTALLNLQGRTPYIRFKLRAQTLPAALRI